MLNLWFRIMPYLLVISDICFFFANFALLWSSAAHMGDSWNLNKLKGVNLGYGVNTALLGLIRITNIHSAFSRETDMFIRVQYCYYLIMVWVVGRHLRLKTFFCALVVIDRKVTSLRVSSLIGSYDTKYTTLDLKNSYGNLCCIFWS